MSDLFVEGDHVAVPPSLPSDAPPWLKKAFDDLTEVDMGMFWNPAVKAWLELEKAYDYASPKTGNLSTTNRPKEIANWIKYGRKPSAAPTFKGEEALGKIAKEFWAWWKALQPSWRVWPREITLYKLPEQGEYGEEWTSLLQEKMLLSLRYLWYLQGPSEPIWPLM